jgi:excinuclease UvrABC helicase subunit UvrB
VIVGTPLLFDLAQAVNVERLGPHERSIQVPNSLVLTSEAPQRLPQLGTLVTTDIQRQSFVTGVVNQLAASQAAQNPLLCTLGEGLWDFEIFVSFYNSATEVPTLGTRLALNLLDPGGFARPIMGVGSVANQVVTAVRKLRCLLAEDGWNFAAFLQATDVAEERHIFVSIWAAKLL